MVCDHVCCVDQDGIISPETDSGFVGSESSRRTPAAATSYFHQRSLKRWGGATLLLYITGSFCTLSLSTCAVSHPWNTRSFHISDPTTIKWPHTCFHQSRRLLSLSPLIRPCVSSSSCFFWAWLFLHGIPVFQSLPRWTQESLNRMQPQQHLLVHHRHTDTWLWSPVSLSAALASQREPGRWRGDAAHPPLHSTGSAGLTKQGLTVKAVSVA